LPISIGWQKLTRVARHQHLDTRCQRDRASDFRGPQDVLGMHFFSPAKWSCDWLEIVRGAATAPDALATRGRPSAGGSARCRSPSACATGFCRQPHARAALGRKPSACCSKGAANRKKSMPRSPGSGFRWGRSRWADMAGLDVGWRIRKGRGRAQRDRGCAVRGRAFRPKRTGKGYFRYDAGSRTPVPDPEVERIIIDASTRLNRPRRSIRAGGDRRAHDFPR